MSGLDLRIRGADVVDGTGLPAQRRDVGIRDGRIVLDTDGETGTRMGRAIIMHIDDAPWVRGGPKSEGDHPDGGGQLIGDLEKGPWVHVNWLPGGLVAPKHSHDHDEVMVILEGGFSMGQRRCGPGTVVFIEANTQYGFEVWEEGVRFLNIRHGLSMYTETGSEAVNPYDAGGADRS